MTLEMIAVASVVAVAAWAYAHFSGKAFDKKYGKPQAPMAPHEQRADHA